MRVLFVCRGNICRSRVAAQIFESLAWNPQGGRHETRSAGVEPDQGGRRLTSREAEWADIICAMEPAHQAFIRMHWPEHAGKVRVFGIPDVYEPHDAELWDRLTELIRALLVEISGPGATTRHDHQCEFCDSTWSHEGSCARPPASCCPWCLPLPDQPSLSTVSRGAHLHGCAQCGRRWRHAGPCGTPTVSDRLWCRKCEMPPSLLLRRGALVTSLVGVAVLVAWLLAVTARPLLEHASTLLDRGASWSAGAIARVQSDWAARSVRPSAEPPAGESVEPSGTTPPSQTAETVPTRERAPAPQTAPEESTWSLVATARPLLERASTLLDRGASWSAGAIARVQREWAAISVRRPAEPPAGESVEPSGTTPPSQTAETVPTLERVPAPATAPEESTRLADRAPAVEPSRVAPPPAPEKDRVAPERASPPTAPAPPPPSQVARVEPSPAPEKARVAPERASPPSAPAPPAQAQVARVEPPPAPPVTPERPTVPPPTESLAASGAAPRPGRALPGAPDAPALKDRNVSGLASSVGTPGSAATTGGLIPVAPGGAIRESAPPPAGPAAPPATAAVPATAPVAPAAPAAPASAPVAPPGAPSSLPLGVPPAMPAPSATGGTPPVGGPSAPPPSGSTPPAAVAGGPAPSASSSVPRSDSEAPRDQVASSLSARGAPPPGSPGGPLVFLAATGLAGTSRVDSGRGAPRSPTIDTAGRAVVRILVSPADGPGASGLGFVADSRGYVLTQDDLVRDAKTVEVVFADGRRAPVRQVWRDQLAGVAVLKIDGRGLTALPLGDSGGLRVGDVAIVVGGPAAMRTPVTRIRATGSATGENLAIDAPISTEHSGSPVVDVHGRVVGIAAAEGGLVSGLPGGSAIPIDRAKAMLQRAQSPTTSQSQLPIAPSR